MAMRLEQPPPDRTAAGSSSRDRLQLHELYGEKLRRVVRERLAAMATAENERLGHPLLDADGRVNLESFKGAVYDPGKVDRDVSLAQQREAMWYNLYDDAERGLKAREFGVQTEGRPAEAVMADILQHLEEHEPDRDGPLGEMVTALLLHHGLGEKFAVARAAKRDDHEHGVDLLIVNRATGEVVCAFDEIVDAQDNPRLKDGEQQRVSDKEIKTGRTLQRGGATVDYGFTFQDGALAMGQLKHVPLFALSLHRGEVREALWELQRWGGVGMRGGRLLHRFIEAIDGQSARFADDQATSANVRSALQHFRQGSLRDLRLLVERFPT